MDEVVAQLRDVKRAIEDGFYDDQRVVDALTTTNQHLEAIIDNQGEIISLLSALVSKK